MPLYPAPAIQTKQRMVITVSRQQVTFLQYTVRPNSPPQTTSGIPSRLRPSSPESSAGLIDTLQSKMSGFGKSE